VFRSLRPDDAEAVLEVLEAAFERGWPNIPLRVSPLDHLRWKMDCPRAVPSEADGPSVVEVDGRVVGYDGVVGRDAWVRGRPVLARFGVDTAIHPDFQGRGLRGQWREWERRKRDPSVEAVGLGEGTTHPRLLRSQRRRGERGFVANRADILVYPMNFGAIARGGREGGPSPRSVLRACRLLVQQRLSRVRWRGFGSLPEGVQLREIAWFDDGADRLWERTRETFDYAVVRDGRYLNWRFCDPRAGVYEVRGAERPDGELAGYVVVGAIGEGAQIVDLLAEPGNTGALRALIGAATDIARKAGATTIELPMPRKHPYREVLARCGFVVRRSMRSLGFDHDRPRPHDFLIDDREARYHYAFGDSDHI